MEIMHPEDVKYIIVHHTQRKKDFPAYIRLRHVHLRGWEHIGYHYIIGRGRPFTRAGRVYACRPESHVGAHALGYNRNSIGVCLIGDMDKQRPTHKQIVSLVAFLKEKMSQYGIPAQNVLGHCEIPGVSKSCPGRNVNMASIREALSGVVSIPCRE